MSEPRPYEPGSPEQRTQPYDPGPAPPVPPAGSGRPPVPVPAVPSGTARVAIVVAICLAMAQVLVFVASVPARPVADRILQEGLSAAAGSPFYLFYSQAGGLAQALALAAFVVGCLWLHTSRAFVVATRPEVIQERGPVWVWLGWVVPVVSLWFPFQVVGGIRRGSVRGPLRPIGAWWFAWLIFVSSLFFRYTVSAGSESFRVTVEMPLPAVEGVGAAAGIVALVLWIQIIRTVTAGQRELTEADAAA